MGKPLKNVLMPRRFDATWAHWDNHQPKISKQTAASLLMGMDYQTLVYLGYSLASLATLGAAYFFTKDGLESIKLTQDDIQLIA